MRANQEFWGESQLNDGFPQKRVSKPSLFPEETKLNDLLSDFDEEFDLSDYKERDTVLNYFDNEETEYPAIFGNDDDEDDDWDDEDWDDEDDDWDDEDWDDEDDDWDDEDDDWDDEDWDDEDDDWDDEDDDWDDEEE